MSKSNRQSVLIVFPLTLNSKLLPLKFTPPAQV